MALNTSGLTPPGELLPEATRYGQIQSAQHPTWGVGNPLAVAMAGLEQAVDNFGMVYDDVQVNDFMLRKRQELDQKYFHPETGLFNTRRGSAAQGVYNEYVEDAKRITNEDAVRELNERQRGLINQPLATMFTSFGHQVGSFETTQLMQAQVEKAQNAVFQAQEMIGNSGNLDIDSLGFSYNAIQQANMALGKMQGWNDDTVIKNTKEQFGAAVAKGSLTASVTDPVKAAGALETFRDQMTEESYVAAKQKVVSQYNENIKQKFWETYHNSGKAAARTLLLDSSTIGRSAARTAQEESRGDASAIRADHKGVSVGLFQIQKTGAANDSFSNFTKWLDANGEPEIASKLKAATLETLPDVWKEAVANGEMTNEMQIRFMQESHIEPTIAKLPEDLRQRVNDSQVFMDAVWSTATQHGSSGAARLMTKAWNSSGMDNRKFFENLYEDRKTQFTSHPQETQKSIAQRMDREKKRALADLPKPTLPENPKGLIEKGNIDIYNRPVVQLPDGSIATVATIGINYDDKEYVIPTVINGKMVSDEEAKKHFVKTHEHFGAFDNPKDATTFAIQLHEQQDQYYNKKGTDYDALTLAMKPATVHSLLRQADALDRQKSSEANRIMRDLFPKAQATFLQTGDATAFDQLEALLIQTGDEASFLKFKSLRDRFEELNPLMQENAISGMSLPEQHAQALKWISERTSPGLDGNADIMQGIADSVNAHYANQMAALKKDPAGFVAELEQFKNLKRQQDGTPPHPDPIEEQNKQDDTPDADGSTLPELRGMVEADIAENMRLQIAMSGDPDFIPKVFSGEQRVRLKAILDEPMLAPKDRFKKAMNISQATGKFSEQAFSELGLNGGANTAVSWARQMGDARESEAVELFALSLVEDADVYLGNDTTKNDAIAEVKNNPYIEVVNSLMKNTSTTETSAQQTRETIETFAKAQARGKTKLLNTIAGDYALARVDEGFFSSVRIGERNEYAPAILMIPTHMGVDPDGVRYGAARITDKIKEILPPLPEGASAPIKQAYEQSIAGIKQTAVWISTDDGANVMMFHDGKWIPDKHGNPIKYSVTELNQIYKDYQEHRKKYSIRWAAESELGSNE